MEPNKKDDNKPLIPTLRDSANKPQLKIKGLAQGGMSLIERLKQFKKKDLAFIMAGLGVLFMAPLAEHFMMAPEGAGDGVFQPGTSARGGAFGSSTPYETGGSSMAPGSALGTNGDVITPLNVRDPSALVMGPGAAQQAPAGSPSAPTPPSDKKESGDWKDALSQSAASAGKAAVSKAALPVPKVPLSQSGLRGLGAISGGGAGGSFNALGAPSAANVPNRAAENSNMAGVRTPSNYKGVARGPGSGASGGFDALKNAANKQGSDFNRSGASAGASLDAAASRSMGDGSAFGGASGESNGPGDKGPGGNQGKDSKSVGESLEFLRMKAEQDHAIDLEWKLKEKAAMRWPNLEDKILEETIMTPYKAITASIADSIKNMFKGGGGTMACVDPTLKDSSPFNLAKGDISDSCATSSGGSDSKANPTYGWCSPAKTQVCKCTGGGGALNCSDTKNTGGKPNPQKENGQSRQDPRTRPDGSGTIDSSQTCDAFVKGGAGGSSPVAASGNSVQGSNNFTAGEVQAMGALLEGSKKAGSVQEALTGDQTSMSQCGGASYNTTGKSINAHLAATKQALQNQTCLIKFVNKSASDATTAIKQKEQDAFTAVNADLDSAAPKFDADNSILTPVVNMLQNSPTSTALQGDQGTKTKVQTWKAGNNNPLTVVQNELGQVDQLLTTSESTLTEADGSLGTAATGAGSAPDARKQDETSRVTAAKNNVSTLRTQVGSAREEYRRQMLALQRAQATTAGAGVNRQWTADDGPQDAGNLVKADGRTQVSFQAPAGGAGPYGVGSGFLPMAKSGQTTPTAGDDNFVGAVRKALDTGKTEFTAAGDDQTKKDAAKSKAKQAVQTAQTNANNMHTKATAAQGAATGDATYIQQQLGTVQDSQDGSCNGAGTVAQNPNPNPNPNPTQTDEETDP